MKEMDRSLKNSDYSRISCEQLLRCAGADDPAAERGRGRSLKKSAVVALAGKAAVALRGYDQIALIADNCPGWIVIYFACLFSGKELFCISPGQNDAVYRRMLGQIRPQLTLWAEQSEVSRDFNGRMLEQFVSSLKTEVETPADWIAAGGSVVLFTTGTTGLAKGVRLTLPQISENACWLEEVVGFEPSDTIVLFAPFYKAMGMIMLFWGFLWGGKCILSQSQMELLHAIVEDSPDVVNFPPIYLGTLRTAGKYIEALRKCKAVIVGSAGVSEQLWAFYEQQGIRLYNGYGMTECVSAIAISDLRRGGEHKMVYPLGCCEMAVDERGEILVRGNTVSPAYLDGSPIVDDDGWYHTGDRGAFHGEQLEILGRLDQVMVMENGIKWDLNSIKKRLLTDENILACSISVEKIAGHDGLAADVQVRAGAFSSSEQLKERINSVLDSFEQIERVRYSEPEDRRQG